MYVYIYIFVFSLFKNIVTHTVCHCRCRSTVNHRVLAKRRRRFSRIDLAPFVTSVINSQRCNGTPCIYSQKNIHSWNNNNICDLNIHTRAKNCNLYLQYICIYRDTGIKDRYVIKLKLSSRAVHYTLYDNTNRAWIVRVVSHGMLVPGLVSVLLRPAVLPMDIVRERQCFDNVHRSATLRRVSLMNRVAQVSVIGATVPQTVPRSV